MYSKSGNKKAKEREGVLMKHPGKIVITDNKVKFEYYELEKPKKENYYCCKNDGEFCNHFFDEEFYNIKIKEYEASKRVIDVNNVVGKYTDCKFENENKVKYFEDGQKCEAEVTNKLATIIKIN